MDVIALGFVVFVWLFLLDFAFKHKGEFWAAMAMILMLVTSYNAVLVDKALSYGSTNVPINTGISLAFFFMILIPFMVIVGLRGKYLR